MTGIASTFRAALPRAAAVRPPFIWRSYKERLCQLGKNREGNEPLKSRSYIYKSRQSYGIRSNLFARRVKYIHETRIINVVSINGN